MLSDLITGSCHFKTVSITIVTGGTAAVFLFLCDGHSCLSLPCPGSPVPSRAIAKVIGIRFSRRGQPSILYVTFVFAEHAFP
jgi:hypothetical protein